MTQLHDEAMNELSALLRSQSPEPLSEEAKRMRVGEAIAAVELDEGEPSTDGAAVAQRSWARAGLLRYAAAALVLLAAGVSFSGLLSSESRFSALWVGPQEHSPLRDKIVSPHLRNGTEEPRVNLREPYRELQLPGVGRLTLLPNSRYLLSQETQRTVVNLKEGALLLDIEKDSAAHELLVRGGGGEILVKGTVFTVEVQGNAVRVHVFEGKVEVTHKGKLRALGASESFESEGASLPDIPLPLKERGEKAAERRAVLQLTDLIADADEEVELSKENAKKQIAARALVAIARKKNLSEVRASLRAGHYQAALLQARDQLELSPRDASWLILAGDCARARKQYDEAIGYYQRLADLPSASARQQGGYLAARLELKQRHAPLTALALLAASGATQEGTALEEQALTLQINILKLLDQNEAMRRVMLRYLERFPKGNQAKHYQRRRGLPLSDTLPPAQR